MNKEDLMDKLDESASDSTIDVNVNETELEKPTCQPRWRYITAVIGFYAMFNSYSLRTHLSVTMVAMVNYNSSSQESTSCPSDNSTSSDVKPGPFDWDSELQGILFGGFYWGYIVPQIIAGRLAEIYGPNRIVLIGGTVATVATAIGPWAANVNVWFFFVTRIICGLGLAVFTPSLHSLIAKWTPPNERSRLSAFMYSGGQMGVIVSMPVAGVLCQHAPNGGWPWPFYVFAIISGVWLVLWFFLVYDSPAESKWISKYEKDLIERKLNTSLNNKIPRPPYKKIFKSKPFCGLMWTHFGHNWGYYTLLTQIPTYMSNILHYNLQENGLLSAVPYLVLIIIGYCCSALADQLIKRNKLSVTHTRKTFQTIALCGSALFLFVITFLNCQTKVIYTMLVLAVGLDGAMYAGYQINHVDLSPNFAGTLQGITNSLGCIPGIISPYLTGIITSNSNNQQGWNIIFYITFGVLIVCALEYVILGSGELQYWNKIEIANDKSSAMKKIEKVEETVIHPSFDNKELSRDDSRTEKSK